MLILQIDYNKHLEEVQTNLILQLDDMKVNDEMNE